ncbi:MAG TPA: S53 family peptidase, partial [Candidatus Acidoferrales bacterium]
VHGVRNAPHSRQLFSSEEVTADIEVAAAAAPGARLVVYFAPNTERGFFDAVTTAIHDRHHRPGVVSISWGEAETQWTPRTLHLFNEALAEAALVGVTVCCSAGDRGSSDGLPGGAPHVIFPASSPFVLACGGTSVDVEGSRIARETVWNSRGATGGGPSRVFAVPRWQGKVKVPGLPGKNRRRGRGVPDVAANADPLTGYKVRFRGKNSITGGTSLAAPMWAALVALINQKLRRPVGYVNPFLYKVYKRLLRAGAFHPITEGNNGAYHARAGWNACCGLGSPHGENLLRALK